MPKRFALSVLVLFILTFAGGFVVHGGILGPDYALLAARGVYRTPEAARPLMAFMLLANLSLAIGFTWVYRVGRDGRHWAGQGLRFGFAIALLCAVPTYLIYYVVTPMPGEVVVKQVLWSALVDLVLGLATAFVNSDPRPEAQPA
jgi:hypothetical protein